MGHLLQQGSGAHEVQLRAVLGLCLLKGSSNFLEGIVQADGGRVQVCSQLRSLGVTASAK